MQTIVKFIEGLILSLMNKLYPMTDPADTNLFPPKQPVEPSNREKLYQVAFSCYGKDIAPTQDFLGCAEAVSHVFLLAGIPSFNHPILSTELLNLWLSSHFKKIPLEEIDFGDVLISVTGTGNGLSKGHVGIVGKHLQHVMSNNSYTGLFEDHWTIPEWLKWYRDYAQLDTFAYRWE